MNPKVIEAATKAYAESMRYRWDESASPPVIVVDGDIESAIKAADAARAEDVWDAFEAYEIAVTIKHRCDLSGGTENSAYWADEVTRTRRNLLALLGIPEDGA